MRNHLLLRIAPFFASLLLLAGCSCEEPSESIDAAVSSQDSGPVADSATPALDAFEAPEQDAAAGHDATTPPSETVYRMQVTECFTFATATSEDALGDTCGDMFGLEGLHVDLGTTGEGGFCLLPGTYSSLAAVPSDFSGCTFTSYVEGADGLSDAGMIVRSPDGATYYRVRIISNELPELVFSFARID